MVKWNTVPTQVMQLQHVKLLYIHFMHDYFCGPDAYVAWHMEFTQGMRYRDTYPNAHASHWGGAPIRNCRSVLVAGPHEGGTTMFIVQGEVSHPDVRAIAPHLEAYWNEFWTRS